MAFQWVQKHHAIDMEENLALQHQLRTTRTTIEELNKNRSDYGDEIMRLQSKLSLAKAYMRDANTPLCHAECKANLTRFKECKSLVV